MCRIPVSAGIVPRLPGTPHQRKRHRCDPVTFRPGCRFSVPQDLVFHFLWGTGTAYAYSRFGGPACHRTYRRMHGASEPGGLSGNGRSLSRLLAWPANEASRGSGSSLSRRSRGTLACQRRAHLLLRDAVGSISIASTSHRGDGLFFRTGRQLVAQRRYEVERSRLGKNAFTADKVDEPPRIATVARRDHDNELAWQPQRCYRLILWTEWLIRV